MQIHVDKIINSTGLTVPTEHIDNRQVELATLNDVSLSNVSDGDQITFNSSLNRWVNSSFVANSLQSHWGGTEGINAVNWGGSIRALRVGFYGGKAWVEIMYSADSTVDAPWNGWIDSNTNGLMSYNLNEVGGLDYNGGASSILVIPEIITNLLVTAKNGIEDTINPDKTMDCSHMNTANRSKFFDYFTGVAPGFELIDTFGWSGGVGAYDTHLGYRNGTIQNDEWLIQDSLTGGSIGAPLWGYRSSGSNQGAKARGVDISTSNVLSVWATNY